jgi:hypothetical protein
MKTASFPRYTVETGNERENLNTTNNLLGNEKARKTPLVSTLVSSVGQCVSAPNKTRTIHGADGSRFQFRVCGEETGNETETRMETSAKTSAVSSGKVETDRKRAFDQNRKRDTEKSGSRFQKVLSRTSPRKALPPRVGRTIALRTPKPSDSR